MQNVEIAIVTPSATFTTWALLPLQATTVDCAQFELSSSAIFSTPSVLKIFDRAREAQLLGVRAEE